MCAGCGARAIQRLSQNKSKTRLERLAALPGYRREIHVSQHGVTGNGIMRIHSVPGVRITQRREDDGFVYTIVLDSPDDYDAVMALIEESRPESAKAEAARISGARPAIVARMLAARAARDAH
jgi:hypothetical protein